MTDGGQEQLTPEGESPGAIDPAPMAKTVERTGHLAATVALGIFVSRIFGFVRQGIFSRHFGTGLAADAYNAAMRIPNLLQNLFGEGVLSASFIPVYSGLLAKGEREEADRVAGVVGTLLAAVTSVLVLLGMLATPLLVSSVAAGFGGEKRELTIVLVRIAFPGIGLLVGGAWCLGILNSHRKFFVPYLAPVVMNLVIIGSLLWWGERLGERALATKLAWAGVVGSLLQLAVQLPTVWRLAPGLRAGFGRGNPHVRAVVRNFFPVFVGRGVVQISGYIDNALASLVAAGAVTVFTNAQTLYQLPGSLFGMAISAAELPAMSSLQGDDRQVADLLRPRLCGALRRIAFFVVPSAVAFLSIGDVLAGAIFRYGKFTHADVIWVWGTLAGSSVGLLASTMGRLYASTFYALKETRTPLRFALLRVALTLVLGYLAARPLPRLLGIDPKWGTAGLTATAGLAGWVEFALLRAALNRRIGATGVPMAAMARLWVSALLAAVAGWSTRVLLVGAPSTLRALATVAAFGGVYLAATVLLGEGEALAVVRRVRRRFTGRR